jgi:hypothetical protein
MLWKVDYCMEGVDERDRNMVLLDRSATCRTKSLTLRRRENWCGAGLIRSFMKVPGVAGSMSESGYWLFFYRPDRP